MTATPQLLKGFRDILPAEKQKRDIVAARIKAGFELFGFQPVETPTLEYASLLLGKYGTEADSLVYTFQDKGKRQIGLRYDQTVPTARLLSQYQHLLPRYFRRYQMQNVFRADKPQKGRYREFSQCDIDIFGSTSPLADAEILACTYHAYRNIGFTQVKLIINDRQTLISTLSPFTNPKVDVFSLIQSIDKLDKQTPTEVTAELVAKGLPQKDAQAALQAIEKADQSSNLQEIVAITTQLGVPAQALDFNPKLARGLDYYTGLIFEVKIPEYSGGSVGGGGRYDNLIEQLGGTKTPAVGMAFGFDRTVEAADELGLLTEVQAGAQVLVTIFDQALQSVSLDVAAQLRQAGIKTELYPALDKMAKQFKVANEKNIPYVVVIGQDEQAAHKVTVKTMSTGEQQTLTVAKLIDFLYA